MSPNSCVNLLISLAAFGALVSVPIANAKNWSDVHRVARGSILFVQTIKQKRDGTDRETSTGTAFVVSDRGYALTVAHLVPKAAADEVVEYKVALGSRQAALVAVQVVKRDTELDLALLRLPDTSKWVALPFGPSRAEPEGSPLYTLGFPRVSDLAGATGVLSNTQGPQGLWQTTLPLEHGNSGSPLLDIGGKVVGIASGGIDDAKQITYAVPSDYAQPILLMVLPPGTPQQQASPLDGTSLCGSMTVTDPERRTGYDGTPYDGYYDFTRGRELIDGRACGREFWITTDRTHPLFGRKFVYLVDGYKNRISEQLYMENPDGTLRPAE